MKVLELLPFVKYSSCRNCAFRSRKKNDCLSHDRNQFPYFGGRCKSEYPVRLNYYEYFDVIDILVPIMKKFMSSIQLRQSIKWINATTTVGIYNKQIRTFLITMIYRSWSDNHRRRTHMKKYFISKIQKVLNDRTLH